RSCELLSSGLPCFIPGLCTVNDGDHGEHQRDFNEYADYRRQCGARLEAEKTNRRRHGQFKEIARSNEGGWTGDTVFDAQLSIEHISQAGVEHHLYKDGHCKQCNNEGLLKDSLALEGEKQNQRQQQGANGQWSQLRGNGLEVSHTAK